MRFELFGRKQKKTHPLVWNAWEWWLSVKWSGVNPWPYKRRHYLVVLDFQGLKRLDS